MSQQRKKTLGQMEDGILYKTWSTLYPIPTSVGVKADEQSLQVIALGLSRTGTESLSKALNVLGYGSVAHGMRVAGDPALSAAWIRLTVQKMRRTPAAGTSSQYRFDSGLRADTFDTILRPYAALTDNPGTLFAEELIAAYPDAKIIVNKRSDIDAWHTSWKTALLPFCFDWHLWALSFFDRELFWMVAGWTYLTTKPYCVHSWDEQGRQVYQDHYSWIDVAIKRHGRAGTELCWEVHDGWEPLCNFLGRSIPEQPFPNGNGPEDFTRLINEQMHTAKQRAWRNVVLCLTTSIAISAYLVWST